MNYKRMAGKTGHALAGQSHGDSSDFPIEKVRLQVAMPLLAVFTATLIPYGWALEQHVPLYVPLILQGIIGFCGTGTVNILSALLVDFFPRQAATASAASNLVRCWLSAVIAAVLDSLLSGMGRGWGYTFFGLIVVIASPLLGLTYRNGMKWRTSQAERDEGNRSSDAS